MVQWQRIFLLMQVSQVQSLGWEYPLEKGIQSTPVFLPGKSHEEESLISYSLCSLKESDMTEHINMQCAKDYTVIKLRSRYSTTDSLTQADYTMHFVSMPS